MICKEVDKDFYILKIFNDDLNIYDHNEVRDFIEIVYERMLKKYNLKGIIVFDIYLDTNYGMIVEVKRNRDVLFDDVIDVKIKFNINISFLYEVDYFYVLDNDLINQNVYYYKDKFYVELVNEIDRNSFVDLLDNSNIIYNDEINSIINNGIKLEKFKLLCYCILNK